MIRSIEARLAAAEAALSQGPGGMGVYRREHLAAVLRSLGRPDDDAAVNEAQGELREDGPLQRAWLAAGHELHDIMLFLYESDWRL